MEDWEPLAEVREAERRKQEKADQRRLANMSPEERARTVCSSTLTTCRGADPIPGPDADHGPAWLILTMTPASHRYKM